MGTRTQQTRNTLLLATVLAFFLIAGGSVVVGGGDNPEKVRQAMDYFNSAQYDKALDLLTELAKDKGLDKSSRKEVLLALGRVYLAKSLPEKAHESIGELLALEPPIITLDPDAESPPMMRVYYDVRKAVSGSSQVEKKDPGMKTIAILDFRNNSIDEKERFDPMQMGFADLMIGQLNGAVNLKVVERERIGWLLDEIKLQNDPSKFDKGEAVRVGKLLGVHSVLLGSFIKTKDEIWISSRLVKVETGEILITESVKGEASEFFDLAEKLSVKVANSVNVTISEADVEKGTQTQSLDAMMLYSEGLIQLEKGNYKAAYEKFQQALEQDPTYEKARKRADSIKPLV